jgi:cytochrome c peroxidase
MRTDTLLVFGSFLLTALLIIASKPSRNTMDDSYTPKAIGYINQGFKEDLNTFSYQVDKFVRATAEFEAGGKTDGQLKAAYRDMRDAFKRVDFLLEYVDKEAYDKVLNGAPLPKLEPKVADFNILQPKGLQVVDELMGEESLIDVAADLHKESEKLQTGVRNLLVFASKRRITDRQFFEASRQSLVRLITLGITGFDTPGTTQGVTDAAIVMATLEKYLDLYETELSNVDRSDLFKKGQQLFKKAGRQLARKDFDDFDRLGFIKESAQPIYAHILEVHLALDYETIDEVSRFPLSVNYRAENLFAKDFLNRFYYVSAENDDRVESMRELGELLFFDPILSSDNRMSCASCHAPEKAFTDGLTTSLGNNGEPIKRNAMTLNYSVYASGYFHDMRTKRLEDQFEHVVVSEDEFDSNYVDIIAKLEQSPEYSSRFQEIFPDQGSKIRPNQIDYALVAYVMSLNPFDSSIDRYLRGEINDLPEDVKRGFNLFAGKAACATCHFMPLFSGTVPPLYVESESEVLGVPEHKDRPLELDDDRGRITNGNRREVAQFFESSFKTPTVRNIAKTGPYMHNGVFNTLEEVMDFYNEGGGAGRGIPLEHQTLAPDPLGLTDQEIADVIAFMEALSDQTVFEIPASLPKDFRQQDLNHRELGTYD